jgi:Rrf2 family iron-sulfur cluster assembly transcriptional regulator
MIDYLDSVSLQDLVDQQRMRLLQEASQAQAEIRLNRVPISSVPA